MIRASEEGGASPSAPARPRRVLVVDDDRDTAQLTALVLEGAGFKVTQAHSGLAALEQVSLFGPDLVLLDINMDAMDGWETLRLLRVDDATRELPVAMFSVKYDIREKIQGMQLGATDYITKPFGHDELIDRVTRIFERCHTSGPPAADSPYG